MFSQTDGAVIQLIIITFRQKGIQNPSFRNEVKSEYCSHGNKTKQKALGKRSQRERIASLKRR